MQITQITQLRVYAITHLRKLSNYAFTQITYSRNYANYTFTQITHLRLYAITQFTQITQLRKLRIYAKVAKAISYRAQRGSRPIIVRLSSEHVYRRFYSVGGVIKKAQDVI